MSPEEIKLAAMLAGQTNQGLAGAVKANPINPHEFLAKAGVTPPKQTVTANQIKIPGMIEQPKSTPSGTEIVGKVETMPDLIPIPDDLKKFIPTEIQDGGDPTKVPGWKPTAPTISASAGSPVTLELVYNELRKLTLMVDQIAVVQYQRLKKPKSKYKFKKKSINETNSTMVTRPGNPETTTPGTSAQNS